MSSTPDRQPLAGLRVAYVAFDPFPNRKGSGTRLFHMTRALSDAGAEVRLITLPPACPDPGPRGVSLRPLRVRHDNYLHRVLAFRDAVARELVSFVPDVVHFRGPFEGQAAVSYARNRGVRTVYEVNGLPSVELVYHYPAIANEQTFEGRLRTMEQRLFDEADVALTQSEATERFLRLRGMPLGKTTVIRNGANPKQFMPDFSSDNIQRGPEQNNVTSAQGDQHDDALVTLYEGTLAPWQGIEDVLVALRKVRREHPMKLRVVGAGRKVWKKHLQHMARRLKVADAVTWTEAVSRDELAEMIRRADICLVPLSRDRRNRVQGCSPIKVFEYMASGAAVLASDLPALRELIEDNWDGVLARPSHPGRLAERWQQLAADEHLRERLGEHARARIVREATWAHRRAELVAFYEQRVLG